ncbi:hypothetical protein Taro_001907, partial [Colocasia esculenta]|nr:hypothetical protein [Colocasia esculenta]
MGRVPRSRHDSPHRRDLIATRRFVAIMLPESYRPVAFFTTPCRFLVLTRRDPCCGLSRPVHRPDSPCCVLYMNLSRPDPRPDIPVAILGRVEELLVAEELWNDHKKLFFFLFSSAATCTNRPLEVDQ